MLSGTTFRIITLGCRSNQYEAEAISSGLIAHGSHNANHEDPHIIIIITCSITSQADTKARKIIRKTRKQNPESFIVVTGCYAENISPTFVQEKEINLLVGNRLKHKIPELIIKHIGEINDVYEYRTDLKTHNEWDALHLHTLNNRTRAFIKIQDGCNHRCSYCIVPDVRGLPVSRPPKDIFNEIVRVTESGCREIILTGINIGLYNHSGLSLTDIIYNTTRISGVRRLRISSIEPLSISEKLLVSFHDSSVFCPHLHIPLQSGSDMILQSMNRNYTADIFRSTINRARCFLGDKTHFSTDIIVGFPGESESCFSETLSLIKELKIGKIHIFPYSKRPGTPASTFPHTVTDYILKDRMRQALELADTQLDIYSRSCIGKKDSIIIEKITPNTMEGWTQHYVRAVIKKKENFFRGDEAVILPLSAKQGVLYDCIICTDKEK